MSMYVGTPTHQAIHLANDRRGFIQLAGQFRRVRLCYLRRGNISRERSYLPGPSGRIFEFGANELAFENHKSRIVLPAVVSQSASKSGARYGGSDKRRSFRSISRKSACNSFARPPTLMIRHSERCSPRCFSLLFLLVRVSRILPGERDARARNRGYARGIIGELSRIINGTRAKSKTRGTNGP